jgi:hypothetical protein
VTARRPGSLIRGSWGTAVLFHRLTQSVQDKMHQPYGQDEVGHCRAHGPVPSRSQFHPAGRLPSPALLSRRMSPTQKIRFCAGIRGSGHVKLLF